MVVTLVIIVKFLNALAQAFPMDVRMATVLVPMFANVPLDGMELTALNLFVILSVFMGLVLVQIVAIVLERVMQTAPFLLTFALVMKTSV
jgi:hypothetical protein